MISTSVRIALVSCLSLQVSISVAQDRDRSPNEESGGTQGEPGGGSPLDASHGSQGGPEASEGSAESAHPGEEAGPGSRVEEARAHFELGLRFYDEENYSAASFEFETAYELSEQPQILFNIGRTRVALNDYAGALEAFERFLDRTSDGGDTDQRRAVEEEASRLRLLVGSARIRVDPPDAVVFVDNERIGAGVETHQVRLNVGRHAVRAEHEGRSRTATVNVPARGEAEVEIEFPPVPVATREIITVTNTPNTKLSNLTIGVLISAGAMAVATGVFLGVQRVAQADLENMRETFPGDPVGLPDAADRARAWAIAFDVSLLVTAALATTGFIMLGLDVSLGGDEARDGPGDESAPDDAPPASARLRFRPFVAELIF